MERLTHVNDQGRAKMVDVSAKEKTSRTAVARTTVTMNQQAYDAVTQQKVEKGDVLAVAQVAGIMAAKQTSQWIPMCHPLPLTGVDITFTWEEVGRLAIHATVKTKNETGVEMEALTAVSAAALTVYDMCKALDKSMTIASTYLVQKTGGKSGDYQSDQGADGG